MKRYIIIVTGKVQGVSFRRTAQQIAVQLGISGFARNEPDGSVHIEAEGSETAIQEFLDWCRGGSTHSEVVRIEHQEQVVVGHEGFEVR